MCPVDAAVWRATVVKSLLAVPLKWNDARIRLFFFSAQTYGWVQKDAQMDVGGGSFDSSEFFFLVGESDG